MSEGGGVVFIPPVTPGTTAIWVAPNILGGGAGNLVGITNGSNAPAGVVGEYISSDVALAAPVSCVNGVTVNLTSIVLTPGDWDVRLQAGFINVTATGTLYASSLSLVSATIDATFGRLFQLPISVAANGNVVACPIVPQRLNVTINTTVFAVVNVTFSAGTVNAFGLLSARRMR